MQTDLSSAKTEARIQLRGYCQRCGRQQAVTRGHVAQHGYEVKGGYFQGACSGHYYAPIETERTVADQIIVSVREDAVRLRQRAADLAAGRVTPEQAQNGHKRDKRGVLLMVPFERAADHYKSQAVREQIANCEGRARSADAFAGQLERLCNERHGKPLLEVKVQAAPEAIKVGERRLLASGRAATVTGTRGAVVLWTDERGFKGRTASRSWRGLAAAPKFDVPDDIDFEPEADPNAWKARDDALIAAHRAKQAHAAP